MSAYCPAGTLEGDGGFPKKVFLFAIAIIMVVAIGYGISHAVTKHGSDAHRVRSCMTGDPFWFNPENGYYIRTCNVDDTHDGIQVLAKNADGTYKEVTAFLRKFSNATETLENYLIDKGYINLMWK